MESSKCTVHHIKQIAGDPQEVQINLLNHQCTELPARKYKKKKTSMKSRQSNYKQHGSDSSQVQSQHKKWFDVKGVLQSKDRCSKCGDSAHVEGFQYPAKMFQCKACHKFGHFTSLCYQKNKHLSNQGNQRCTNYKQTQYMPKIVSFAVNLKMTASARIHFVSHKFLNNRINNFRLRQTFTHCCELLQV